MVVGRLGKYEMYIWPHGMVEIRDPRGLFYIRKSNIRSAMLELAEKENKRLEQIMIAQLPPGSGVAITRVT